MLSMCLLGFLCRIFCGRDEGAKSYQEILYEIEIKKEEELKELEEAYQEWRAHTLQESIAAKGNNPMNLSPRDNDMFRKSEGPQQNNLLNS